MAKPCISVWKWRHNKWLVTMGYLLRGTIHESSNCEWVAFLSKRSTGNVFWVQTLDSVNTCIYKFLGLCSKKKEPFRLRMLINWNISHWNSNENENVVICYRIFFRVNQKMKPITCIYQYSWNSTKNQNKFDTDRFLKIELFLQLIFITGYLHGIVTSF